MKKISGVLLAIALLFVFSVYTAAIDTDFDNLEESISDELFSAIDKDVLSVLQELGIDKNSLFDISNVSLKNISAFFGSTLKEKAQGCLSDIFTLLCVILLSGGVASLFAGSRNESFISNMSVVLLMLLSIDIVAETVSATVSVLKLSGSFMLSFVPIYTLIISLSGNAAAALTYNSLIMAFGEVLSSVIAYILPDLSGLLLCLIISFSLNESINISRLINFVNKTVSVFLGLFAGAFTGFLSLKNILSASLDSVSVKSVRFLISSLIPVIGSSISEAYSSLLGSINLIKGSVAFVGIIVILIINLPVLAEALIYYLSFTALSYLSDGFSGVRAGECLRGIACALRILMLLCVFEMFILIISTGIMLSLKGTV